MLFTPRGQSDSVTKLVGADGENLAGELVRESVVGFNLLEVIEKWDVI